MLWTPTDRLCDLHFHTHLSWDGYGSLTAYCEAALRKGLAVLGVTDHHDVDVDDPEYSPLDYEASVQEVAEARRLYGDRLTVLHGVEVDYQHEFEDAIRHWLEERRAQGGFDYVIGSVHRVGGRSVSRTAVLAEADRAEWFALYCERIRRSALSGMFHIIGHLEYGTKRAPVGTEDATWRAELAREAIAAVVSSGCVLEVNTAGLRHGAGQTYPGAAMLRLYREAGGRLVTLGSDAHSPDQCGTGLAPALRVIEEAGLRPAVPSVRRDP